MLPLERSNFSRCMCYCFRSALETVPSSHEIGGALDARENRQWKIRTGHHLRRYICMCSRDSQSACDVLEIWMTGRKQHSDFSLQCFTIEPDFNVSGCSYILVNKPYCRLGHVFYDAKVEWILSVSYSSWLFPDGNALGGWPPFALDFLRLFLVCTVCTSGVLVTDILTVSDPPKLSWCSSGVESDEADRRLFIPWVRIKALRFLCICVCVFLFFAPVGFFLNAIFSIKVGPFIVECLSKNASFSNFGLDFGGQQ